MHLKLLVVENDRSSAALMSQVFTAQGAEVQTVNDAADAFTMSSQKKFDGIFLELALPDLDGVELTHRIRRSSWNTRTPIVLVSKNTDAHAAARAFQVGGTFFLPKPLNAHSIRRALFSTRPFMFDERRRYTRISLSSPLQLVAGSRELTGCGTLNLSSTGMLMAEDGTLRPKDNVRLLFGLDKGIYPVLASAQVVWVNEQHRAGVRFIAMSHDDRARIRKRIALEIDNS